MATVSHVSRRRSRLGRVAFGAFGDVAADTVLSSPTGKAAYAAWQAAEAKLPSGWVTGDPVSSSWGNSYFQIMSGYAAVRGTQGGPDGQTHYLLDPDGSGNSANYVLGPVVSSDVDTAVTNATNIAYGIYNSIQAIRTASPEMFAILTDPEWVALEGSATGVVWSQLSAELQAKIKLVPFLYESLTSPEQAQADAEAYNAANAPKPPTGPVPYLVDDVGFMSDGTVTSVHGIPVTGKRLTAEQTQRLISGGTLSDAEIAALLPPPPAQAPYVAPPGNVVSSPATSGGGVSSGFAAANAGASGEPLMPPGQAMAPPVASSESLLSSPYVLGAIAIGLGLLVARRRR